VGFGRAASIAAARAAAFLAAFCFFRHATIASMRASALSASAAVTT
jgi:hypothetical protein